MSTLTDLPELLKFRTEIGRELLNSQVDENFRFVANPWSPYRTYTVGMVVYAEVDPVVTGGDSTLGWFRACALTTRGTFLQNEWQPIGDVGGSFGSLNLFNRIVVNSTDVGIYSTAADAVILPAAGDSLKFVTGTGIELDHDIAGNLIRINTDLTLTFDTGTSILGIDGGSTVDLSSLIGGFWDRDDGSGFTFPLTISDDVGVGTITPDAKFEVEVATSSGLASVLLLTSGLGNILDIDDSSRISIGEGAAVRFREVAQAGISFTADGDAQTTHLVARHTTGAAAGFVEVFLDGIGEKIDITATSSIIGFKIAIAAIEEAAPRNSRLVIYKGAIKNNGGTTSLIGAVTEESLAEDAGASTWDARVTSDASGYLKVEVKGDGTAIRWVADIELTEINIF